MKLSVTRCPHLLLAFCHLGANILPAPRSQTPSLTPNSKNNLFFWNPVHPLNANEIRFKTMKTDEERGPATAHVRQSTPYGCVDTKGYAGTMWFSRPTTFVSAGVKQTNAYVRQI